jgi:NADH:ubiquinone oxidoreductase subunit 2 (subunit N)
MIYMLVYLVMNLGAFLVVIVVAQATGSETIDAYRGLARRHPMTAIAFAICLFSLTGLPPFAGFTGKWYHFVAVLQNYALPGGGWYAALAIIGAINSAVSLYYYMRIVRAMFLDASVATAGKISIRPTQLPDPARRLFCRPGALRCVVESHRELEPELADVPARVVLLNAHFYEHWSCSMVREL